MYIFAQPSKILLSGRLAGWQTGRLWLTSFIIKLSNSFWPLFILSSWSFLALYSFFFGDAFFVLLGTITLFFVVLINRKIHSQTQTGKQTIFNDSYGIRVAFHAHFSFQPSQDLPARTLQFPGVPILLPPSLPETEMEMETATPST